MIVKCSVSRRFRIEIGTQIETRNEGRRGARSGRVTETKEKEF